MKEGGVKSMKFISKLRRNKYDVSINVYPSNRKEYNVINFLLGAKKRVAARYLRGDKENLGFLNNVRVFEDDFTHNVRTNLNLLGELLNKKIAEEPPLSFYISEEDRSSAADYLNKANIKVDDKVVGFHPGSALLKNHIHRRWEPEKFIVLGKELIANENAKILIFGGPEEKELKERIAVGIGSNNAIAVEAKGLPQSAAIMKRSNLFVSNDSSLMHVASALQLKVIAIIGPTNPAYIHPWKTEHEIVTLNLECAPCFIYSPRPLICFREDVQFKCIKELTVHMVYETAKKLLV
jgi:heptosyltransferase II